MSSNRAPQPKSLSFSHFREFCNHPNCDSRFHDGHAVIDDRRISEELTLRLRLRFGRNFVYGLVVGVPLPLLHQAAFYDSQPSTRCPPIVLRWKFAICRDGAAAAPNTAGFFIIRWAVRSKHFHRQRLRNQSQSDACRKLHELVISPYLPSRLKWRSIFLACSILKRCVELSHCKD
jgi:hypothetical protein